MSELIFGRTNNNNDCVIPINNDDKIVAGGHTLHFSHHENKNLTESSSLLTVRVIPIGAYAGFFLQLKKSDLEVFKKNIDKAYEEAKKIKVSNTSIKMPKKKKAAKKK